MIAAYSALQVLGCAHSIEVLGENGVLLGGLYGIAMGQVFFGESMFSRVHDASKVALVALVDILCRGGFQMIDCQVQSDHMDSMGARLIKRLDFERRLAQTVDIETGTGCWRLPATCGGLL
jgi:leucyl/phenylalanyl-tRNA--protein transferase